MGGGEMSETMDSPFLEVHVTCGEAYSVSGGQQDVVMIPFTGTADGPYFSGRIPLSEIYAGG